MRQFSIRFRYEGYRLVSLLIASKITEKRTEFPFDFDNAYGSVEVMLGRNNSEQYTLSHKSMLYSRFTDELTSNCDRLRTEDILRSGCSFSCVVRVTSGIDEHGILIVLSCRKFLISNLR
jgi:hypothetical protein